MKKLLASLALMGAVGLALPALAEDAKPAAPATAPAAPVVDAPAAAPQAPATPATVSGETTSAPATPAASPAAAATTAAPAPAAAPEAPKLDAGNTAWMLVATALVLFMTIPGLALFYGGMVRKKNVLATLMQSFAIAALVTLLWTIVGYSLAFAPGNAMIGGLSKAMLNGIGVNTLSGTIPESVFFMFQLTFAIITPALITGAFAERMKFSSMLLFMALWSLLVYSPVAHWVWEAGGWLFNGEGAKFKVLDYAGGTVVHINAGIAGLVCAFVLGKRVGFGREAMPPHNLVLTLVGASMLWVGWFGFNAGSALAADGRAGYAMLVTQIASATAALSWMFVEWFAKGKPSVLGIASGAVAGLVAITPASGFVGVGGALAIGLISGGVCYWGATGLKHLLGYDDSLDAFGVHGVGGIVGAILTGVFAVEEIGGTKGDIVAQLVGVGVTIVYSGVMTFILLKIVDVILGLRVADDEQREGLDLALHGERVE